MKIIPAFVILFVTSLHAMSQCDKKVTWHASRVDMVDAKGSLLQGKEATIRVNQLPSARSSGITCSLIAGIHSPVIMIGFQILLLTVNT